MRYTTGLTRLALSTLSCVPQTPDVPSLQVVLFNGVLFAASIAGFVWIMVLNASRRAAAIQEVKMDPLVRGCPSIHTGLEYLQWIPGERCPD